MMVNTMIMCRCSPAFLSRCQQQRSHAHRNVVLAATATDKLPELKQKLKDFIDTVGTSTAFPPEALPVLEEIDAVAQENGVPEVCAAHGCGVRQLPSADAGSQNVAPAWHACAVS